MYKNLTLVEALEPISSLTKGSKNLFEKVLRDGYRILTKNSKPTFALVDIKTFEELASAKEELDELKRQKFDNLVEYLKTVPTVQPTKDDIMLMSEYDNDLEEKQRIQKIIEERRKNVGKVNRID